MISNSNIIFSLIVLLSLAFLFTVDRVFKDTRLKSVIFSMFFIESIVLVFFFPKVNPFLAFAITMVSVFFMFKVSQREKSFFSGLAKKPKIYIFDQIINNIHVLGIILFLITLIYEIFADLSFSSNTMLSILLSFLYISYKYVPIKYKNEIDFMVVFFTLITFTLLFPQILFQIADGMVGRNCLPDGCAVKYSIFEQEDIVYNLLGKPLSSLLSIFGFNTFASGQSLLYEDLSTGTTSTVIIAKSCAGIISIQIFTCALISYYLVEFKRLDGYFFLVLLIGLVIAYFANLFRMAIIVIIGHYWGMDALLFAHQYVGWLLFTFWILLFGSLINRTLIIGQND